MVGDEDVEISEGCEGCGDKGFAVFRCFERLAYGEADGGATEFGGEGFGLRLGGEVTEGDAGSGLAEEADGGSAYSAGASGHQGSAAFE
jgi:hypothetical protein